MITKTLKFGMTGIEVIELQNLLRDAGFFKGISLGNFKDITFAAVKTFQLARGLKVDGIVGPQTMAELTKGAAPFRQNLTTTSSRELNKRFVPEELRTKIESFVFPGRAVPQIWINREWRDCARAVMNALIAMEVREVGGNNKGYWVGLIQSVLGRFTTKGDSAAWCLSTQQIVIAFLEDYFRTESMVYASEHCMTTLRQTMKTSSRLVSQMPSPGALIIWENVKNGKGLDSGHVEMILKMLSQTKWETGGGNTGDSSFSDGDGIFRKQRTFETTGSRPVRGFILMWEKDIVPL